MAYQCNTTRPSATKNVPAEVLAMIFRASKDEFQKFLPPDFHKVCRQWESVDLQIRKSSGTAITIPHSQFDQDPPDAIPNLVMILHSALQRATETGTFLDIYLRPWKVPEKSGSTVDLAPMFYFPNFSHCVRTLEEQVIHTGVLSRATSRGIKFPNLKEWHVNSIVLYLSLRPPSITLPKLQRLYVDLCSGTHELNTLHCESLTILVVGWFCLDDSEENDLTTSSTIESFGRALCHFPNLIQIGLGLAKHGPLGTVTVSTNTVRRLGLLDSDPENSVNCWSPLLDVMPNVREITFGAPCFVHFLGEHYPHPFQNIIHLTINAVWYNRFGNEDASVNPLKQTNVIRRFLLAFPSLVTLEFKAVGGPGSITSYYVPGWHHTLQRDRMGWFLFMEELHKKEPLGQFCCPLLRHIKLEGWNIKVKFLKGLLKTIEARGKDGRTPGSILLTTKSCHQSNWEFYPDVTERDYTECMQLDIFTTHNTYVASRSH